MNYTDEELQSNIENKRSVRDSVDAKAYQKVFRVLSKEPYVLPADFADRVVGQMEAKGTSIWKDYFWFGMGLFSFVIAAIVTVVKTNFKPDFGVLKFISGSSGLLLFGLLFVLLLHWLDKKILWKNISVS